ncbi:hypothetical protein ACFL2B_01560 [Patescibacteria group bacterium]
MAMKFLANVLCFSVVFISLIASAENYTVELGGMQVVPEYTNEETDDPYNPYYIQAHLLHGYVAPADITLVLGFHMGDCTNTDFTFYNNVIMILAGENSSEESMVGCVYDDIRHEPMLEIFRIEILTATCTGYEILISENGANIHIEDNEPSPTIIFTHPAFGVDEGLTGYAEITTNYQSEVDLTVKFLIANQSTATVGEDFLEPEVKSATISSGNWNDFIAIATLEDEHWDPDETIILELYEDTGQPLQIGEPSVTELHIIDNDPLPTDIVIDLQMPAEYFHPGDPCYVVVDVLTESAFGRHNLFLILDVFGSLFFFPSYTTEIDWQEIDVEIEHSQIWAIPEFSWPNGAGSASGLIFYAGITDAEFTPLSNFETFTFGWGP